MIGEHKVLVIMLLTLALLIGPSALPFSIRDHWKRALGTISSKIHFNINHFTKHSQDCHLDVFDTIEARRRGIRRRGARFPSKHDYALALLSIILRLRLDRFLRYVHEAYSETKP
ncbi:uncharacterized protein BDZ99DRAFT_86312 [Mytilinidion resinicola]|uniref:Uncharacterized protein n=1 Tax=Mytilinidion resinicola TaxID=574789 RepID=A0A6A6YDD9_9PEZI|nr:uncharacterized protein BDZ99DRAFT_86312 [Mytilinidion resinicola]KAF2806836.1 hypothetical protein BDZ99DRAFT_86312 [Mytilinidion resinicola]